jgi:CHASE2 domain-containing sensor protein
LPLNTGVLNPIKYALADFDFNDLAYAKLGKNAHTEIDNRIMVVNIGTADRGQLAGLIESISRSRPKVIGLDAQFTEAREPETDSLLKMVIETTPNLVLASSLDWSKDRVEQKGFFGNDKNTYGYVNFIGEDKGTIRYFSPIETDKKKQYLCFTAALLEQADQPSYKKLLSRHRKIEQINYRRRTPQYHVVNGADILEEKTLDNLFADKIVLMGYIESSPNDIEDKHFTPMNAKFAGKALPDMNGVVIHANILSMMLDKAYVKRTPAWLNWIIVILVAWVHMSLFIRYYIDQHLWFHLVAKLAQIVSAILFVYLSIICFTHFSLEIDMKMPVIVIILAIDVIYFYEAFAVWLHKKRGFQTIFHHNEH